MKHLFIAVFSILFCNTVCISQSTKNNAISFEWGKTGLIYNINFDHKLAGKNVGFRVGAGSNFGRNVNLKTVGGGGYYLLGQRNSFLELGVDLQYLEVKETSDDQRGVADILIYPDYSIKTFYPSLNIGYRGYGRNLLFRAGVSPGMINSQIVPGGYLSLGVRF